ncbi:MAG: hypothetical protein HRU07_08060 [Nitrosopumilus sp.]|nr:hypothetical protein [Nitrosopumilus sp.]NRA06092.1 hypothetical protein [Nitrosopumilus sp.]
MRNRRALSSVIGMIFLVIVLSSTIGYFTYGIGLIEKLNDEVLAKGLEMQDKTKESFEIIHVGIDGDKFNFTVQNTGSFPINITRLWVNNVTDSSWPLQNFTVNKIVSPDQVLNNVGQNIDLYTLESQSYSLRLVTERGNLFNARVLSPQSNILEMNLFSAPRTVFSGQNVTIWYGVTNNATDGSILQSITPQIEDPVDVTGSASAIYQEGPTPTTKESLTQGDTVFFKWIYKITGSSGEKITFNATVNNAKQGNYVTEQIDVMDVSIDSVLVQNAGLLQVEYESLEWAQGTGDWSNGWNLDTNTDTVWRINVTNNDPTDTFYIGEDTALVLLPVGGTTRAFYIGDNATANPPTITAYTSLDQSIAPGEELRVYFGATTAGGLTEQGTPSQKGINQSPILVFGEMCTGGSCPGAGTDYGQTIPFLGILLK